jgi:hypothetical protein
MYIRVSHATENLDKAGKAIQNLLQYDQRRSKYGICLEWLPLVFKNRIKMWFKDNGRAENSSQI